MVGRTPAVRLGGICGILYVVLMIPAYIVGSPDAPISTSSAQEVFNYFDAGQSAFLFFNGVLVIFSAFFFVWFLGILHSTLRRAEDEEGWLSSVALAGGVLFITLQSAGVAVEINHPATLARFENFQQDAPLVFISLVLSSWLYHFCQVGMSVLVSATSLVALRTRVVPGWLALLGFVVALLVLLHFLIPLLSSLIGLLWVVVISVLMLAGLVGPGSNAASPHIRRLSRS